MLYWKVDLVMLKSLLFAEVFLAAFNIWDHSIVAFVPVSWANFAVFSNILKSFDCSKRLINISANWEIVDCLRPDNAGVINDKHTS